MEQRMEQGQNMNSRWPFNTFYVEKKRKQKGKNISNILKAEMKCERNDNWSVESYKIIKDRAVSGRVNMSSVNGDIDDEQLTRLSRWNKSGFQTLYFIKQN